MGYRLVEVVGASLRHSIPLTELIPTPRNVLKVRAQAKKEASVGVSEKSMSHKSHTTLHFPTVPRTLVKDRKSKSATHSVVAKPSRRDSSEREVDALKMYRRAWQVSLIILFLILS